MNLDEFDVVAQLRRRFPLVGDDAAVVEPPSGPLLLATDAIVEGVDFTVPYKPEYVGRRAVAVNVSDIAAMGGRPLHLLVSIIAPAAVDVLAVVDGVAAAAASYGCGIAGGDLSATAGPLVVSIAITGLVEAGDPVFRAGARAGDVVFVTGPLGGAAASGYTTMPVARVDEGIAARKAGATAMIDVSDGFAADLGHLLDASRVGVVIDHVPVADGATEDQALGGGEDYELIFTLPSGNLPPRGAIAVGTITGDVTQRPPPVAGWQHRFS